MGAVLDQELHVGSVRVIVHGYTSRIQDIVLLIPSSRLTESASPSSRAALSTLATLSRTLWGSVSSLVTVLVNGPPSRSIMCHSLSMVTDRLLAMLNVSGLPSSGSPSTLATALTQSSI